MASHKHAAYSGNIEIVQYLLERGADVNAPAHDDAGMTALQAAAIQGYLPIALWLLQEGADVLAPGAKKNGRTALDGAAEHGRLDMLQLLLNHLGDDAPIKDLCEQAASLAE